MILNFFDSFIKNAFFLLFPMNEIELYPYLKKISLLVGDNMVELKYE